MHVQYLAHLALPVEPDIPVSELVYEPHKPGYNSIKMVPLQGRYVCIHTITCTILVTFDSLPLSTLSHSTLISFLLIPIHPSCPSPPHHTPPPPLPPHLTV